MSGAGKFFEQALQARLALRASDKDRLIAAVLNWAEAAALEQARTLDATAACGGVLPPLAGMIMSVKANVDVAGWTTSAGSRVRGDEPAARDDAPIVAALRAAGAIILAQTNMVEFAYGALGQNAYFGTPHTPVYPGEARLTGGSSSGAGVTVAVGLVDAAIGTDTSGSVRIPAAFCGVAGFKPTQGRYSEKGIVPLALTLDTAGFLAPAIAACRLLDAVVTGGSPLAADATTTVAGLRFVVPRDFIEANCDADVLSHFDKALDILVSQGAVITNKDMPYLADIGRLAREGGIVSAESYVWHRPALERAASLYDPRVGPRIAAGANIRAIDYIAARQELARLAEIYHRDIAGFAAHLMPTNPVEPPLASAIAEEDRYLQINLKVMQFTEFANRINVPSLTVPIGGPRRAVGLMANGARGDDVNLLQVGSAIEACLAAARKNEGSRT